MLTRIKWKKVFLLVLVIMIGVMFFRLLASSFGPKIIDVEFENLSVGQTANAFITTSGDAERVVLN